MVVGIIAYCRVGRYVVLGVGHVKEGLIAYIDVQWRAIYYISPNRSKITYTN